MDTTKTISLVGVIHNWELWKDYTEWILDNYPQAKTVMLELPPSEEDAKHLTFFSSLEKALKLHDRSIVRGDTGRCLDQTRYLAIKRQWEDVDYAIRSKKKIPPHSWSIAMSYIGINIKAVAQNMLSGRRHQEFLKNVINYEPDLVVLGSAHTDYLRRHLPHTHYVRFEDNARIFPEVLTLKPDVSIKLKNIERYAFDKWVARRKSALS